jgi:hypothetical protein
MIGCFFARKPPAEVGFLLRVLDCSDLLILAGMYGEARDGFKSQELMRAIDNRLREVAARQGITQEQSK